MKKTGLLFAMASIALLTITSCKKSEQEKQPITETINVTVNTNETYSYTLPAGDGPAAFTIVKQSTHSSTSVIEKNASGQTVYYYTPSTNFTGSDNVVLSNEKDGHTGQCDHPHGECKQHKQHHGNCEHDGEKHIITINFTMPDKGTATKTSSVPEK